MNPIRCAIADDEPPALDLLESYVRRTEFLELVARSSSAEEALEAQAAAPADLLVADIQMPGLLGTELVRILGAGGPLVVFSTAVGAYAAEGFDLDAVDYLLKPYDYARFLKAALKARERLAARPGPAATDPGILFVRCGTRLVRVDVEEILFVEGFRDYVRIWLRGSERPVLALASLKALEARLPGGSFVRVHRSFIVHLRHVDAVGRKEVSVAGRGIPVADTYRASLDRATGQG